MLGLVPIILDCEICHNRKYPYDVGIELSRGHVAIPDTAAPAVADSSATCVQSIAPSLRTVGAAKS